MFTSYFLIQGPQSEVLRVGCRACWVKKSMSHKGQNIINVPCKTPLCVLVWFLSFYFVKWVILPLKEDFYVLFMSQASLAFIFHSIFIEFQKPFCCPCSWYIRVIQIFNIQLLFSDWLTALFQQSADYIPSMCTPPGPCSTKSLCGQPFLCPSVLWHWLGNTSFPTTQHVFYSTCRLTFTSLHFLGTTIP